MKYQEIQELHKFCVEKKIKHKFSRLYDGYKIDFPDGSDCIQHEYSTSSKDCIEFWLKGRGIDVTTLEEAKKVVIGRYY